MPATKSPSCEMTGKTNTSAEGKSVEVVFFITKERARRPAQFSLQVSFTAIQSYR